jgi:hypothetical protein
MRHAVVLEYARNGPCTHIGAGRSFGEGGNGGEQPGGWDRSVMQLARGTDIDQVVGTLDDVVRTLQDLGRRPLRQDYLCWVEDGETALRGVFIEPDVIAHLYTARFWRLYDGDFDIDQADITRPIPDPCEQEAAAQLAYVTALAAQVGQLRALAASPGRILVYDTNSLMHYQPPDAIPWDVVAKVTTARLIVLLVVIDELDAKKYAGSEKILCSWPDSNSSKSATSSSRPIPPVSTCTPYAVSVPAFRSKYA